MRWALQMVRVFAAVGVLAVSLSLPAGCGSSEPAGANGAAAEQTSVPQESQEGADPSDGGDTWQPVTGTPEVGDLDSVPAGYALRVQVWTSAHINQATEIEALVIPDERVYRVIQRSEGLPDADDAMVYVVLQDGRERWVYDSAAGTRHFAPGEFTEREPEKYPSWPTFGPEGVYYEWTYGPDLVDPASHGAWESKGDQYRARFTATSELSPGDLDVTVSFKKDLETGIVVYGKAVYDDGNESWQTEVRRELIPLEEVDRPSPDEVRRPAIARWKAKTALVEQAPFTVYGLDLPGLHVTDIQSLAHHVPEAIAVSYGTGTGFPLADGNDYPVVELAQFPADTPEAAKVLADWGEPRRQAQGGPISVALSRGNTVVRVTFFDQLADSPGNPIPELGLTLDKVLEAIVPLNELPGAHLDPPPGYAD